MNATIGDGVVMLLNLKLAAQANNSLNAMLPVIDRVLTHNAVMPHL